MTASRLSIVPFRALLVRAEDRERSIAWETAPVPADYAEGSATFVVMAAIDVHESPLRWDLRVDGRDVLHFRNPLSAEAGGTIRWEGQDGVVATSLKRAEDGRGYLIRLYNPGSVPDTVRITGFGGAPVQVRRSDVHERILDEMEGPIQLGGYEIMTLRVLTYDR